ncbi:MAG: SDR family oxidoreductase [Planctomycetota bacterium]
MAKVLITGASRGFGKLTVEALLAKGHDVAAAMRDPAGRNKAVAGELSGLGAKVVELDVTQDGSVADGVAQAVEALGGLDVVVNNAGVGVLGLQESFTPEDWKKLFDVNVFGVQRVARATLPHLRAQRSGLMIQVSSLLGRVVMPWLGPYNASKWALEAMSENYRVELSRFGVDVTIVEPGGYATTFTDALLHPSDHGRDATYGGMAEEGAQFMKGFEETMGGNPDQDPRDVADAIVALVETPAGKRPFRTAVDKLGMADAIRPYNDALEALHDGLYGNFGMNGMRRVATGS